MIFLQKIHIISTAIALIPGFFGAAALFLLLVDEGFDLNILAAALEVPTVLAGSLFGVLFAVSTAFSILLSLFFLARK